MKKGYFGNIEKLTLENEDFRRVLYTAKHQQLVLMSIKPNDEIGLEVHDENDQFLRFEQGKGRVIVDEMEYEVANGDAVIVSAGSRHNIINISNNINLKLYTIYSPPHHKDGITHSTKEDAEKKNESFDGKTTE